MEQEENKRLLPSVPSLWEGKWGFSTLTSLTGLSGTKVSWVISSGHPPHVHTPASCGSASCSKGTASLGTPKALCFAESADQSTYAILPLCCQGNT